MRLGDLGIRQPLDNLHGRCGSRGPVKRPLQKEVALLFGLFDSGPHLSAEQAVATTQMVIEEGERRSDRECVQPQ